jgi:hypothetical protein
MGIESDVIEVLQTYFSWIYNTIMQPVDYFNGMNLVTSILFFTITSLIRSAVIYSITKEKAMYGRNSDSNAKLILFIGSFVSMITIFIPFAGPVIDLLIVTYLRRKTTDNLLVISSTSYIFLLTILSLILSGLIPIGFIPFGNLDELTIAWFNALIMIAGTYVPLGIASLFIVIAVILIADKYRDHEDDDMLFYQSHSTHSHDREDDNLDVEVVSYSVFSARVENTTDQKLSRIVEKLAEQNMSHRDYQDTIKFFILNNFYVTQFPDTPPNEFAKAVKYLYDKILAYGNNPDTSEMTIKEFFKDTRVREIFKLKDDKRIDIDIYNAVTMELVEIINIDTSIVKRLEELLRNPNFIVHIYDLDDITDDDILNIFTYLQTLNFIEREFEPLLIEHKDRRLVSLLGLPNSGYDKRCCDRVLIYGKNKIGLQRSHNIFEFIKNELKKKNVENIYPFKFLLFESKSGTGLDHAISQLDNTILKIAAKLDINNNKINILPFSIVTYNQDRIFDRRLQLLEQSQNKPQGTEVRTLIQSNRKNLLYHKTNSNERQIAIEYLSSKFSKINEEKLILHNSSILEFNVVEIRNPLALEEMLKKIRVKKEDYDRKIGENYSKFYTKG